MPGVKGKTNNPNGRPKTGEAFIEQLKNAMQVVEKSKKKSLMQHAIEQAYVDNAVLIALLRKLIPDLTEIDHNVTLNDYLAKTQKYGQKKEATE